MGFGHPWQVGGGVCVGGGAAVYVPIPKDGTLTLCHPCKWHKGKHLDATVFPRLSRGSNSLHLVVETSALTTTVVDLEWVQGFQSRSPLGPNYFIFMRNFEKKWAKWLNVLNRTPTSNLNPLSKNPGSAPALGYHALLLFYTLFSNIVWSACREVFIKLIQTKLQWKFTFVDNFFQGTALKEPTSSSIMNHTRSRDIKR